jgi:hypothetical protein
VDDLAQSHQLVEFGPGDLPDLAALLQPRGDELFEHAGLTVGGDFEHPQVSGLYAATHEDSGRLGDHEGLVVVGLALTGDRLDETEPFEIRDEPEVDPRALGQLER